MKFFDFEMLNSYKVFKWGMIFEFCLKVVQVFLSLEFFQLMMVQFIDIVFVKYVFNLGLFLIFFLKGKKKIF